MAENQVIEPTTTEVTPTPPETTTEEVIKYEYQPTDAEGRPLHGKQVIEGKTWQEVADKIRDLHVATTRYAQQLKTDLGLKRTKNVDIPSEVPRGGYDTIKFEPKQLTADEKWVIQSDPTSPEALRLQSLATYGVEPDQMRSVLTRSETRIRNLNAKEEAQAFMNETPEWIQFATQSNLQVMFDWMKQNDVSLSKEGFKYAFKSLKESELILPTPEVVEETPANAQREDETDGRTTDTTSTTTRPSRVTSGLNRNNSSATGGTTTTGRKHYTKAETDAMSAEEYKQKVMLPDLRASR